MVKKRTPLHCRLIHRIYEFYQFVIFGNSLKNLNLNIRRSHPQLQGCVVSIYELDKNISRRSKQEHDKTGIHRIYEFYQFVIFGNSLKNLNLNIRRSHPQLQGCVVSIYELDKNISRRSKQEHDKTGIHRQSNPLKESSSYIHYYESKKLPLRHADTQML